MHNPMYFITTEPAPTVSLTEDLPQGADAEVLLLGCGDARNILYTVSFDKGLPERKLDITACDADAHIIARNLLLFTLLLDKDENISRRQIWSIYYHSHLDDPDVLLVGSHLKKLISLSQSLQAWHASPYGATLRFCDETTLLLVQQIWAKYVEDPARSRGPLRPQGKHASQPDAQDRLLMQFEDWIDAFVEAAARTTIRFTASEWFALCYTLRYSLDTGRTGDQDSGFCLLKLAESEYGTGGKAPKQFDVIDTSTFSTDVSVLKLVESAGSLLKDAPSSTLYTAGLYRLSEARTIEAQTLAGWYAKSNSTFLGLVPAEYWTNARASAIAHHNLKAWSDENALPDARDTLFEYRLSWKQSKHVEGYLQPLKQPNASEDAAPSEQTFTVETGTETADTSAITGRINVASPQGQKLLADKAPIKLEQPSPFTIDIVFGNDRALVLPLTFPAPILKEGSKTRIARTSHYIEITAPLADPTTFPRPLDDFLFPAALDASSGIPATFNIPHLNLDTLPILPLTDKSRIRFLTTLTSLMFSTRERRLREEFSTANTSGLAPSPRLNFKESLFTIFMLASGLQGGQTGLFALTHPQRGGIHMLLFVSAIRVDEAHGSVVLDAAVLPFTKGLVESKVLEGFLLVLRTLECCSLTIDDDELALWKKVLPALAERCRTWVHDPERCEYRKEGRVPVSLGEGEQVLCGCGMGKLPGEFVSLPEWETAAEYATRVAISPVYASALVEELIAPDLAKAMAQELAGKVAVPKCRNCGKAESEEVKLKKCMRCLEVVYCSAECQKKDWKKHRMECEESEEHHK